MIMARNKRARRNSKISGSDARNLLLENYYTTLIAGIMAAMIVYIAIVLRNTAYTSYAEAFFVHIIALMVIVGLGALGAWTVVRFYQTGSRKK